MAFEQGRIDLAEVLCRHVLSIDPTAFDRAEAEALFRQSRLDDETRELTALQLRALARPPKEGLPDTWVDIRRRVPHLGLRSEDVRCIELAREVRDKMRSTAVFVDFRGTSLSDVVTCFREWTRLNILIDEEAIPSPSSVCVTLKYTASFEQVLSLVLSQCNLRSYIAQGMLILTTRE